MNGPFSLELRVVSLFVCLLFVFVFFCLFVFVFCHLIGICHIHTLTLDWNRICKCIWFNKFWLHHCIYTNILIKSFYASLNQTLIPVLICDVGCLPCVKSNKRFEGISLIKSMRRNQWPISWLWLFRNFDCLCD